MQLDGEEGQDIIFFKTALCSPNPGPAVCQTGPSVQVREANGPKGLLQQLRISGLQ